ncbi:MAG: glycoside hydrolase family 25 protein [Oscillospiraceae bacterium]|nr:glycoside hydrolase family 25 protein [Oscillospiraceae bacterium]
MRDRIVAAVFSLLLLAGCGGDREPVQTADPYAGMVQVESGYGTKMWVTKHEGLPVNLLRQADFSDGVYTGADFKVLRGVDVSEHQGRIDWKAAASDDIDFAILRAGYRGYGEAGTMRRDLYFVENIEGALANGLDTGVYFFSQATSPEEAEEEAAFLLDILAAYGPEKMKLPVYYDWEDIGVDAARTDGVHGETITACAEAFCAKIREAGYQTGVYAYRYLGYFSYDLSRLDDCSLWIAAINSYPDFYYAHELWQYSANGSVSGITGPVDLDYWFQPVAEE